MCVNVIFFRLKHIIEKREWSGGEFTGEVSMLVNYKSQMSSQCVKSIFMWKLVEERKRGSDGLNTERLKLAIVDIHPPFID